MAGIKPTATLEGVNSLTSRGMIVVCETRFNPKVMNAISHRLAPKFHRKFSATWRS